MTDVFNAGVSYAKSLIKSGDVDEDSAWSFSAADGDELLGASGDDWSNYGKHHLGIDMAAADKTKARWKYPVAKEGELYRAGLIATKQRAAEKDDDEVEKAADALLAKIDGDDDDKAVRPGRGDRVGSIDDFRESCLEVATGGKAASETPQRVRASFDTEVKAKDDTRTLMFTISTASVDRMGDTIAVDGWKLDAYRKNPVVLWAHDSTLLPLAKAPKVWMEGDKLKADAEFTPVGMARFNDTVFDMYKGGFLSATSVGFIPLKYAFTDDPKRRFGIDFIEQELLEFSCCPVPANAEALVEGRSAGIDIAPLLEFAEATLKRAFETDRIVKLAESVLGGRGADPTLLAWAERIVVAAGKAVVTRERINNIERAATAQRLAAKRARELELLRMRGA